MTSKPQLMIAVQDRCCQGRSDTRYKLHTLLRQLTSHENALYKPDWSVMSATPTTFLVISLIIQLHTEYTRFTNQAVDPDVVWLLITHQTSIDVSGLRHQVPWVP